MRKKRRPFFLAPFYTVYDKFSDSYQNWHNKSVLTNWESHYQKSLENYSLKIEKQEKYLNELYEKIDQSKQFGSKLVNQYMQADKVLLEFTKLIEDSPAGENFVFGHYSYDDKFANMQLQQWTKEIILLKSRIENVNEGLKQREKIANDLQRKLDSERARFLDLQVKGEEALAKKIAYSDYPSKKSFSCSPEFEETERLLKLLKQDLKDFHSESYLDLSPSVSFISNDLSNGFPTLKEILFSQEEVNSRDALTDLDKEVDGYRQRALQGDTSKKQYTLEDFSKKESQVTPYLPSLEKEEEEKTEEPSPELTKKGKNSKSEEKAKKS